MNRILSLAICILLLGLLACASKKQTVSTSNTSIFKTAILNLDKTSNTLPGYDYWPDCGIRVTGSHLASLISLKQLNDLLPCQLYKSGPHSNVNWDLDNENSFGYYNPQAISYLGGVTDELLADQQFVNDTRPLIDKYLRKQMRTLLGIYQYIDTMSHKDDLLTYMTLSAEEKRKLWVNDGIGEEMSYPDYVFQWEVLANDVDKGNSECRFDYFWARRYKDGTDKLIYNILKKIYAAYFGESIISKEKIQ